MHPKNQNSGISELPALFSDLALILVTAGITTHSFQMVETAPRVGLYHCWSAHWTLFPLIPRHQRPPQRGDLERNRHGVPAVCHRPRIQLQKVEETGRHCGHYRPNRVGLHVYHRFPARQGDGWSQMDSIFLGAMLSMSSTTIIAKAFDDLKIKGERWTGSVIGVLVVEDLAAILMMVILSTLAMSTALDGKELMMSVVRLIFFLLVWYVGGVFLIPTILKWARKFMTEETLTVFAVGLCFFMV